MKFSIKKSIIAVVLSVSILTVGPSLGLVSASPFVLTAHAAFQEQYSHRMDVILGNHNITIDMSAYFTHNTYVQYYDKNWKLVWAGSFTSGNHVLSCNSKVYTVSIYLDDNKYARVRW